MFCPKCKSLMFPENGKMKCRRCGYEGSVAKASSGTIRSEMNANRELLVVEGRSDTLPKTDVKCPKCGNNEAYWVLRQTRAADEPETRIYRCTNCSYSWREY
ncbi:MAG: transcription factor S [Candidatus Thermoplasmatota archaeon]|nr:transcription factor S [Candidatus Sysuiplasma jiujiangense]MBX8639090.1 transcription factor S [Candidatus Sysuiplasma jiujiangense]MBX8642821.1 transcription factor S [Candidatus Sysuiplasma jiujiangense]MCL5677971.1 transcription factor S [Candidatus Thermoplasmatota archaeon]